MMQVNNTYDVIIIGGSYAGLSAALALGRSMRNVLIIDNGNPCNKQTPHSHNFITQDGATPSAIAQKAKEQVLEYPNVVFHNTKAISGERKDNRFHVTTEKGDVFVGRKIIFATGISDLMPDIIGFSECWGISVIHCPYCHGYEFRKQKTAIIANGERAYHLASLVKNLTDQVSIITSDKALLTEAQLHKLYGNNIAVIEKQIEAVQHENGHVKNIRFNDGTIEDFSVVYAALSFKQHSGIAESLGCELTEQGYIKVDMFQKTTENGVYACGDCSSMLRSVANAVANGSLAGSMCNKELTEEDF